MNAGRGFRLLERRERHLRGCLARLTVSRGGVTTAPIPRRVIAFRLVKRDALSPRVNLSCDSRGSVDIGLNRRNVAVVVQTPELSLQLPPTDTVHEWHVCGHLESRSSRAAFRCTNAKCGLDDNADKNGALNIGKRALGKFSKPLSEAGAVLARPETQVIIQRGDELANLSVSVGSTPSGGTPRFYPWEAASPLYSRVNR